MTDKTVGSFEEMGDLLGILANPSRLQILMGVLTDECSVSRIQDRLGLPQATVSRHLSILKRGGLVKARREGVRTCYQVIHPLVQRLLEILELTEGAPVAFIEADVEFLRALSNPTRLRILSGLRVDECNVKGIQEKLGLPQSTASQHLALLRALGVVTPRRREGRTCYLVTDPRALALLELMRGSEAP